MQRRTTGSILKVRCISLGPPATILLFGVGIRRREGLYIFRRPLPYFKPCIEHSNPFSFFLIIN